MATTDQAHTVSTLRSLAVSNCNTLASFPGRFSYCLGTRLATPLSHSVLFVRMYGKEVVSSIVILEMQAAGNLPSTTVSTVTVAQLPCQLN